MKKIMKGFAALATALCLTLSTSIVSLAGEWKKDNDYMEIWWYQRDDGSYPSDCWETIDGKTYHFDILGYLERDMATQDGYVVDENGVWVESIPQMTKEEVYDYNDQKGLVGYYKQVKINTFIRCYTTGFYYDQAEFEEDVHAYFPDNVSEAERIIGMIRIKYTFVSLLETYLRMYQRDDGTYAEDC
ncbi:hypothetical protein [Clostridium sp. AM58-1XD]|uniref:hypothetical protein n=1 Tax=Clostridium sp. AM58-1XD TaxID=2292307 RepID=UPI000E4C68CE|nr:hypothetical protein [Clostridium sp. AM58-1XD]RGY97046.1 hypothetical protein DXA13_15760 [Clostridium sp. AM58-1XD]